MNDVKIANVDFAAKQGVAASSPSPGSVDRGQGSNSNSPANASEAQEPKAVEATQSVQEGQETVRDAVTQLNDYVQSVQRDLQFQLDDSSGKTIVTVIDSQTSEVVRQIPDEVALKLAQDLQQEEPLSLFNAKA
jgi:flagellar protein FlaG